MLNYAPILQVFQFLPFDTQQLSKHFLIVLANRLRRDPADGAVIEAALREKIGLIPYVLVHAPVCRPGWLIEIEGIAVIPAHLPELPEF